MTDQPEPLPTPSVPESAPRDLHLTDDAENDVLLTSVVGDIGTNEPSAPRPVPESATGGGCITWVPTGDGQMRPCGLSRWHPDHDVKPYVVPPHHYEPPAPPAEPVEEAQRCHICGTLDSDEGPRYERGDFNCGMCGARWPKEKPIEIHSVEVEDEGARPYLERVIDQSNERYEEWRSPQVNSLVLIPLDVAAAIREAATAAAVEVEAEVLRLTNESLNRTRTRAEALEQMHEADTEQIESWRTRAEAAEGALREVLAVIDRAYELDFTNGVTDETGSVDEGDVRSWEIINRARALTAEVTPGAEG